MELEELYRRDLSLLIALQVLIEERSVTQAAKRLHLSQSATSRILSRLRTMLGDPLFTRVGPSLQPTDFALSCQQRLQAPIAELSHLLAPREFTPSQCRQKFTIAVTDFAMQALMPLILPRLYSRAPEIQIEVTPVQHQELQTQLGLKGVDVAMCRAINNNTQLMQKEMGQVGVRPVVAPDHPLANKQLQPEDFQRYPLAIVAISDGVKALLDEAMAPWPGGQVILRTPSLDNALTLMGFKQMILILPSGLAEQVAQQHELRVKTLPFPLPRIDYHLFWHSRIDHDSAQQWLREEIIAATAPVLSGTLA
ncbi:LysR family transcriptional regulator [Ferrimonas sp. SCSIO 43195]|uniref:LysR family transcriptional regulator n=1 Tax=Ferrimonas sp. SCSIO 43195 TaxID=2822844 RepID=UPI0020752D9B|nr:LysR family transcriptional regulator [Ferrimonas sp. SCSIO 43195]USD36586.1 LysR family transcriptional regulator [Ferrimonas sp. SCSIO 43195]